MAALEEECRQLQDFRHIHLPNLQIVSFSISLFATNLKYTSKELEAVTLEKSKLGLVNI